MRNELAAGRVLAPPGASSAAGGLVAPPGAFRRVLGRPCTILATKSAPVSLINAMIPRNERTFPNAPLLCWLCAHLHISALREIERDLASISRAVGVVMA